MPKKASWMKWNLDMLIHDFKAKDENVFAGHDEDYIVIGTAFLDYFSVGYDLVDNQIYISPISKD